MRITIQALIDGVEGSEPRAETIGVVERDADGAPASGLGLFLRETHAVLRQLQAVVLREQVVEALLTATNEFSEHYDRTPGGVRSFIGSYPA